jgi:hypothetical protein
MVHREKFSQPKYDIIFQIAKTYTMSEIDSRKTNTNSSYTGVYRDHKYFKGKKLSKTLKKFGRLDTIFIVFGMLSEGGVIQMPAFTYLYLQFLTDWLVTLPQYFVRQVVR